MEYSFFEVHITKMHIKKSRLGSLRALLLYLDHLLHTVAAQNIDFFRCPNAVPTAGTLQLARAAGSFAAVSGLRRAGRIAARQPDRKSASPVDLDFAPIFLKCIFN